MWVEIVRVIGWSRCPTTRRSMLCRKISIIIKSKIHASLSFFSMQICHIKHQQYFFKKNKRKQTKQRKKNIFFFFFLETRMTKTNKNKNPSRKIKPT